jgi:hypothetical protein
VSVANESPLDKGGDAPVVFDDQHVHGGSPCKLTVFCAMED